MLNQVQLFCTNQYTVPIIPVNRQFKNNADIDVVIYTLNHKLTIADRLVMAAFKEQAHKHDDDQFRISVGLIAAISGVHRSTASLSIRKLLNLRYLKRWNHGGIPLYVVADEILSVRYTKDRENISFYSDNPSGINKNIYIYSKIDFESVKRPARSEFFDYMQWCMEKTAIDDRMAVPPCLQKKGEKEVKPSILIPDFVENITEVPLTFEDKLELAVFPGPIIDLARKRVTNSGNLTNPIAYFKAICRKEHQQRLQNTKPSFSKTAATKQPSVQKQPPSEQEYAYARYKHLEYMYSVTFIPEAKQRLFKEMQRQAAKLTTQPIQPAVELQNIQKNSNIAPADMEIDEADYESINTHELFGE